MNLVDTPIAGTTVTARSLRDATLAARERTGDPAIGTRVQFGRIQVVRVTFDKRGRAVVDELASYLPPDAALAYLNSLQAPAGGAA